MTVLLVALGAALGAPVRYLTDRAVQARHDTIFPWGTFIINVAGSAPARVPRGPARAPRGHGHRHRAVRRIHHLLHLQLRDPETSPGPGLPVRRHQRRRQRHRRPRVRLLRHGHRPRDHNMSSLRPRAGTLRLSRTSRRLSRPTHEPSLVTDGPASIPADGWLLADITAPRCRALRSSTSARGSRRALPRPCGHLPPASCEAHPQIANADRSDDDAEQAPDRGIRQPGRHPRTGVAADKPANAQCHAGRPVGRRRSARCAITGLWAVALASPSAGRRHLGVPQRRLISVGAIAAFATAATVAAAGIGRGRLVDSAAQIRSADSEQRSPSQVGTFARHPAAGRECLPCPSPAPAGGLPG